MDHERAIELIRKWQEPISWYIANEGARNWIISRKEAFERAMRGEPEPPEPGPNCQARMIPHQQQFELQRRMTAELAAIADYVRTTAPNLIDLPPRVDFTLYDPAMHYAALADRMAKLEAALCGIEGNNPLRTDSRMNAATEAPPAAVLNSQLEPSNIWPPDNGWHFAPGCAAFKGEIFEVKGIAAKLLKTLVEAKLPLSGNELAETVWDDPNTESRTIRVHLSKLRNLLRTALRLSKAFDPIPRVGYGDNHGWRLAESLRQQRQIQI